MLNEPRTNRLRELQKLLAIGPTDVLARCDVASLLEELGQYEEALSNWKAVVASDPTNLKAWEGTKRCRNRIRRSPQSQI